MRISSISAAIAFGIVALAGVATFLLWKNYPWVFSGSYTLRVATGPLTEHGAKFIAAFKREVSREHPRVKINPLDTPSIGASALALQNGEVDIAIARIDDPATAEGRAVFVLKKLYVAILLADRNAEETIADLKRKKLGVLMKAADEIDPLARTVIDFFGFEKSHTVRLTAKELPDAIRDKKIAALLVVGPIGAGAIADAAQVFRKVTRKQPAFLDLEEAEAIAERFPVYDKATIPVGAYNATPALPTEEITTLAAPILLVARANLSNYAAGELTRLLLATKSKVASGLAEAGELGAPSTDRDAVLPAHPGTIAFLNGEQPDLIDESLNYIYLGSIFTGALGSLAAWAATLRNRRQIHELQGNIARLPVLLGEARTTTAENLDATEQELDRLSEWFADKFVADDISHEAFANATTRVAHIRALIEKRRAAIGVPQRAPAGEMMSG